MPEHRRHQPSSAAGPSAAPPAAETGEKSDREELSLVQAATSLLEECRMVLPGIQALFGFQLVAIFNTRFGELLSPGEQRLHLAAVGLVALAIGLIMAPAAYHRQTNPREVSEQFLRVSSWLLLWSMGPLALGLVADFYLVGRVLSGVATALCAAGVLLAFLAGLWFVLPHLDARRPTRR